MTKKIDIDEEELLWMHKARATQGEMAKYFGCGIGTISNRLKKKGIRTAPPSHKTSGWKGGIRRRSAGYFKVLVPEHERADADGYVSMAVVVWEREFELSFPEGMVPHHRNGVKKDDRAYNILPVSPSEHSKLERLLKGNKVVANRFESMLLERMKKYIDKGTLESE